MKQLLPFVFPVSALLIVMFLAFRWYSQRPATDIAQFGEGVEIEELTQDEQNQVLRGVGDYETVSLEANPEVEGTGQVRYDIKDNKVTFSIFGALPALTDGKYQVWLQGQDGKAARKAFELVMDKGGYTGSAAISAETLPFEVLVTKEMTDDDQPEQTIMKGMIVAPSEE